MLNRKVTKMQSVEKEERKSSITKPMLGETIPNNDVDSLPYPLGATYKADGIRALKLNGSMKSRTLKPIKNAKINEILTAYLPENADGEIIVGDTFQQTTSAVMRETTSLNFKGVVTFYWFDWVRENNLKEPYKDRSQGIVDYLEAHPVTNEQLRIVPLIPKVIANKEQLLDFEKEALEKSFEGVMLRTMNSPYKCGRSTLKQAFLLKLKRFVDDEATIIDFDELCHNENEKTRDERGFAKRSSHKENLVAAGRLGAFKVQNKEGTVFKIGTGLNEAQREEYWENRESLRGKLVKYKYFPIGVKEAPRHPVFLGFRDEDDM
jgi:DNA ligase 1